jgi:hypothetical protein
MSTLTRGLAISEKSNPLVQVKGQASQYINFDRLFMIPRKATVIESVVKESKKSDEKTRSRAPSSKTATEDSKISSFSILTAEIQVKVAAEIAFSLVLNRPSRHISDFGFYHGCHLNEEAIISEIVLLRRELSGEDLSTPLTIEEKRKFAHYFGFQNRIVLAVIELPKWALQRGIPKQVHKSHKFVLSETDYYLLVITRDMIGKFSWIYKFDHNIIECLTNNNEVKDDVDKSSLSPTSFASYLNIPSNSSVLRVDAHLESNIPDVQNILDPSSQEYKRFKLIQQKVADLTKYESDLLNLKLEKY